MGGLLASNYLYCFHGTLFFTIFKSCKPYIVCLTKYFICDLFFVYMVSTMVFKIEEEVWHIVYLADIMDFNVGLWIDGDMAMHA